MLSALTGYFAPTKGEIDLLGERYGEAHWLTLRRKIGLVSSSLRQMMADDEPALISVITGKYAMIDLVGPSRPTVRKRKVLRRICCGHLQIDRGRCCRRGTRVRPAAHLWPSRRYCCSMSRAPVDPAARENFLSSSTSLAK